MAGRSSESQSRQSRLHPPCVSILRAGEESASISRCAADGPGQRRSVPARRTASDLTKASLLLAGERPLSVGRAGRVRFQRSNERSARRSDSRHSLHLALVTKRPLTCSACASCRGAARPDADCAAEGPGLGSCTADFDDEAADASLAGRADAAVACSTCRVSLAVSSSRILPLSTAGSTRGTEEDRAAKPKAASCREDGTRARGAVRTTGRLGTSVDARTAPTAARGGAEGGRGAVGSQSRTSMPVVACAARAPVWSGPKKIRVPLGLPGALS